MNAKRDLSLDLLRAVAVILVLGAHMTPPTLDLPGWLHGFLSAWRRGGWVGVDLFFVLSGFLIAGLLFKEYQGRSSLNIGRFYVRRAFKIYPPFYLFITFTVVWMWLHDLSIHKRLLLHEVLFVQNYFRGLWGHTWSLAVEEHFYILLPVLLWSMIRLSKDRQNPFRMIPPAFVVIAIAALILRIVNANLRNFENRTHMFPTHLRIDSLMMGVALSYYYHFHRVRFVEWLKPLRWVLIVTGLAILASTFVWTMGTDRILSTIGLTAYFLASAMLLSGTILVQLPASRLFRVLGYIGAHSYSIYLWHAVVITWWIPSLKEWAGPSLGYIPCFVIYIAGSILIGILMAKVVETPALRLRDRWCPSRSSGALTEIAETPSVPFPSTVVVQQGKPA